MSRPFTYTFLPLTGNETAVALRQPVIANTVTQLVLNSQNYITSIPNNNANNNDFYAPNLATYQHAYTFQSLPPYNNGYNNVYRSVILYSDTAVGNITSISINGIAAQILNVSAGGADYGQKPPTLTLNNPINQDVVEAITPIVVVNGNGDNIANSIGESSDLYKTIRSITVETTVNCNIWVGFGQNGISDPIMLDIDRQVFNTTSFVTVTNKQYATYSVWQTALDIARPQQSAGNAPFYYINPLIYLPYGQSYYNNAQLTPSVSKGNVFNNSNTAWDYNQFPMSCVFMRAFEITTEQITFSFVQESIR